MYFLLGLALAMPVLIWDLVDFGTTLRQSRAADGQLGTGET